VFEQKGGNNVHVHILDDFLFHPPCDHIDQAQAFLLISWIGRLSSLTCKTWSFGSGKGNLGGNRQIFWNAGVMECWKVGFGGMHYVV
jgi:hypothetical protein